MNTSLFDQVRQLSVEEQIELVEALWDNIVERNAVPGPTEAQKAELDRRLSEHAAHPDDVVFSLSGRIVHNKMVPPIGTAIIPSSALECLHGE
jgi:putative addiction module component (TIGR02574 family)